jgi:hypothetical protein
MSVVRGGDWVSRRGSQRRWVFSSSLGGACVVSRFDVMGIGLDGSLGQWMRSVCEQVCFDWRELSSRDKIRKKGFGVYG